MKDFNNVLRRVREAIDRAALAANRNPAEVNLLAVSKRHPVDAIRALARAGQRDFGENYFSEAVAKIAELADLDLSWHFIGPIQSNKTAAIASHFDWVHSIDRSKILRRLNNQRPPELPPLNCCLQINIGEETSKSGAAVETAQELAALATTLPRLRLRGLMCIPPPSDEPSQQRSWFGQLGAIFDQLNRAGHQLDTLSMGMSNDMASAIAEGATIVRIGTALFGPWTTDPARPKHPNDITADHKESHR